MAVMMAAGRLLVLEISDNRIKWSLGIGEGADAICILSSPHPSRKRIHAVFLLNNIYTKDLG